MSFNVKKDSLNFKVKGTGAIPDMAKSIEELKDITSEGTPADALILKEMQNNLTANELQFKFTKNENGEYGYLDDKGIIRPFKGNIVPLYSYATKTSNNKSYDINFSEEPGYVFIQCESGRFVFYPSQTTADTTYNNQYIVNLHYYKNTKRLVFQSGHTSEQMDIIIAVK